MDAGDDEGHVPTTPPEMSHKTIVQPSMLFIIVLFAFVVFVFVFEAQFPRQRYLVDFFFFFFFWEDPADGAGDITSSTP